MAESKSAQDAADSVVYKAYGYRWLILALFSILVISNAVMFCTFAPISNISENYFGGSYASPTYVNFLSTVFLILYLPGSVLGVDLMKRVNLKHTMTIAALLNVIGSFIRFMASLRRDALTPGATYWIMFLGQSIAAVTFPMYVNLPAAIASIWFPANERDMITTAGAMFNPIGNALGQILPVIFVTQTNGDDGDDDGGDSVHGMSNLMLAQFLICVVPFILVVIFFKDAPPTPPSQSTQLKIDNARGGGGSSVKKSRNRHEQQQQQQSDRNSSKSASPVVFGYANDGDDDSSMMESRSQRSEEGRSGPGEDGGRSGKGEENGDPEDDLWTTVYTSPAEERKSLEAAGVAPRQIRETAAPIAATGRMHNERSDSTASDASASSRGTQVRLSHNAWHILKYEMKILIVNKDYMCLLVSFTLIVGILNGLLPVFNQLLEPHGYSNAQAGTLAAVIIVVGLAGAVVAGIVMEKTRAYLTIMKGYLIASGLSSLLFFSLMYKDNFWPLLCSAGLLGFVALPVLPIMMELCAEITYPVPEEVSTGLLHNGANFFAIGIVFVVQQLIAIKGPGPTPFLASTLFIIGVEVIAGIFAMMVQGRYVRSEHDQHAHAGGVVDASQGKSESQTDLRESLLTK